jgi:hypothetical protein
MHVGEDFVLLGQNLGDVELLPIGRQLGEDIDQGRDATALNSHVLVSFTLTELTPAAVVVLNRVDQLGAVCIPPLFGLALRRFSRLWSEHRLDVAILGDAACPP